MKVDMTNSKLSGKKKVFVNDQLKYEQTVYVHCV